MPRMSAPAKSRVSEAEFLSLPESLDHVELIDGEVIVSPSPEFWHQEILLRLVVALRGWASTRPDVTVAAAPLDVRFAPNRILQPDAMVFLTKIDPRHRGPIDRVPEVCVEVVSTDRTYDRVTKRFVYAAAGVAEYWIVDPGGFIERRSGKGLTGEELLDERLSSPLLPGFELDVARLFAGLL
jgi:Uma2 family endonuclease